MWVLDWNPDLLQSMESLSHLLALLFLRLPVFYREWDDRCTVTRLWSEHNKSQAKTLDCSLDKARALVECSVLYTQRWRSDVPLFCHSLSTLFPLNLEFISSARMASHLAPQVFLFPPLPPHLGLQAPWYINPVPFPLWAPVLDLGSSVRAMCALTCSLSFPTD